jgi:hypothetical protein
MRHFSKNLEQATSAANQGSPSEELSDVLDLDLDLDLDVNLDVR